MAQGALMNRPAMQDKFDSHDTSIAANGTAISNGAVGLTNTKTWAPAATAASQGAKVTTTISVPGAVVGDTVVASHTQHIGAQAATLHAYVSAADTVTVDFINTGATAVTLASGTLKVRVFK